MIDQENQLREVAQCKKYSKTATEVEKKDNFWRKFPSWESSIIWTNYKYDGACPHTCTSLFLFFWEKKFYSWAKSKVQHLAKVFARKFGHFLAGARFFAGERFIAGEILFAGEIFLCRRDNWWPPVGLVEQAAFLEQLLPEEDFSLVQFFSRTCLLLSKFLLPTFIVKYRDNPTGLCNQHCLQKTLIMVWDCYLSELGVQ